jgi:hypothetical protein
MGCGTPRSMRVLPLALVLFAGCSYGLRGGVTSMGGLSEREVAARVTRGAAVAVTEGVLQGYAGFGSTDRRGEVSDAIHMTLSLGVGSEAVRGEVTLSLLGGLEYLRVWEQDTPWGFRAGLSSGFRVLGDDTHLVAELSGGPVLRLFDREISGEPLQLISLSAVGQLFVSDAETAFMGGLTLTLGAVQVGYFHL